MTDSARSPLLRGERLRQHEIDDFQKVKCSRAAQLYTTVMMFTIIIE